MGKLLVYMKGYWRETVCAPLFKLLEAFFDLLVPLVMARMIDVGIKNSDNGVILRMSLLMAALGAVGLAASVTAQYFSAKAAVGFSTRLRHELFAHIQALSFTELDESGASTLITRMTSDVNQLQSGVNLFLRLFLRSPFIVIGATVLAFTIDAKAALVFVVILPLLCVIVFGILLISIPLYRRVQERLDAVTLLTRENLQGVRVLRAFRREKEEIRTFEEDNALLIKIQQFSGRISALMNPLTYVVLNGGLIAVLYVGAGRVDAGFLLQGSVVALVNYLSQILVELVKLANLMITVTRAIACGNRVEAVLEIPDGREIEEKGEGAHAPEREAQPGTGNGRGAVSFEQVSFRYRGAGDDALRDLSFSVQPGETIGIIGGTGSGKTSLVSLIPGFYTAQKGTVRVDGGDVRAYPREELRKKIGYVPQKPVLFSGTIRSNLLWGNENATDEELLAAVRAAQAEDILLSGDAQDPSRREDSGGAQDPSRREQEERRGLDQAVEQEGRNFSGGQRQRLTIARALVRRPEILILDDSSSALDFATEARLLRAIGAWEGMTVFLVSQRISTIARADRILVLEDGAAAGIGSHEELLKNCAIYRELYNAQVPEEKKEGA